MIKKLYNEQITKEFTSHVIAFSAAENGAMGNPGSVRFVTDEKEIYEINDICIEIPDGWKHTYWGAGNHLFMPEWMDILFYKIIDRNASESEIHATWIDTVIKILGRLSCKKCYCKERNEYRSKLEITPYNAQRKKEENKGTIRESLCVAWDSVFNKKDKIVAIGINPSTAQDGESDTTMTKLCRFLDMYGFNNVTMLNLFESVSPDQNKIVKTARTDFAKKRKIFDEADIILLVWGINGHRKCKRETVAVLADYAEKLYCIRNQNGRYPAHPSRMSYQSEIMPIISAKDFSACGLQ